MITNQQTAWRRRESRGISVIIVAVGMVFVLGMGGLAIDLASLYVGRSQAQRAADAAALAGASVFVAQGCTSGVTNQSACETLATQQAEAVGNTNFIAGVTPNITDSDITFDFSNPNDPRITVATAHTMPTFFAKIFGVNSANVSATATAEAFNPSGSNISVATACVKPWLLPNCDPTHQEQSGTSKANMSCQAISGTNYPAYFVYPPGGTNAGDVVYPGNYTQNGAMGQLLTIKPGDPHQAAAPSKYYTVYLPPGSQPNSCPACATGSGGGGPNSGSLYRNNIECCNQSTVVCGANATVQAIDGNMVGPTQQGVTCLIHQGNGGSGGQDTFDPSTFTITAGASNPYAAAGTVVTTSDSIVNVPLYSGQTLCPGNSCPSTSQVEVIGLMQLFIKSQTNPQGTVEAYIMNISGCGNGGVGGGGGSGGGNVIGAGGSSIPVRLIRNGT